MSTGTQQRRSQQERAQARHSKEAYVETGLPRLLPGNVQQGELYDYVERCIPGGADERNRCRHSARASGRVDRNRCSAGGRAGTSRASTHSGRNATGEVARTRNRAMGREVSIRGKEFVMALLERVSTL